MVVVASCDGDGCLGDCVREDSLRSSSDVRFFHFWIRVVHACVLLLLLLLLLLLCARLDDWFSNPIQTQGPRDTHKELPQRQDQRLPLCWPIMPYRLPFRLVRPLSFAKSRPQYSPVLLLVLLFVSIPIVSTMSVSVPATYKMVALDLDGTLLRSDHQVADVTRDYIQALDRQGFVVAIATGRGAGTVYEHIRKLNLPHPIPVICSNGARGLLCSVSDQDNGAVVSIDETLFETPVPDKVVDKVITLAKEMGFVTQYYVEDDIYADPIHEVHLGLTQRYKDLTGSDTIYVKDDFAAARQRGLPSKMLVLCPVEDQDRMMERFQEALAEPDCLVDGSKVAHTIRGNLGFFMEVLHPDVCKGHGLSKLCELLKIPIQQCIAFGDGDNDKEFIQMAGRGIVMKNGRDVTKAVADEVLELTNDEVRVQERQSVCVCV